MKKIFVIMMCCLGLAFASCTPKEPANQKFIGDYLGTMYLNGTVTSPQLSQLGMESYPLENVEFQLQTNIVAGSNDDEVFVTFTIDDESYVTTGTVVDNTIQFGTISYNYVETQSNTDLTINLSLTGVLNENVITLSGPFTGSGVATIEIQEGFSLAFDLTASGNVNGSVHRLAN